MADKRIDQLTAATTMGDDDLLVLQQNNQAKKLSGATLSAKVTGEVRDELSAAADDLKAITTYKKNDIYFRTGNITTKFNSSESESQTPAFLQKNVLAVDASSEILKLSAYQDNDVETFVGTLNEDGTIGTAASENPVLITSHLDIAKIRKEYPTYNFRISDTSSAESGIKSNIYFTYRYIEEKEFLEYTIGDITSVTQGALKTNRGGIDTSTTQYCYTGYINPGISKIEMAPGYIATLILVYRSSSADTLFPIYYRSGKESYVSSSYILNYGRQYIDMAHIYEKYPEYMCRLNISKINGDDITISEASSACRVYIDTTLAEVNSYISENRGRLQLSANNYTPSNLIKPFAAMTLGADKLENKRLSTLNNGVSAYGHLYVNSETLKLTSSITNQPVQLKGFAVWNIMEGSQASTFYGLQSMRRRGANVVRVIAMPTTNGHRGYVEFNNKDYYKRVIKQIIYDAISLDMYVLLDWHILHKGLPTTYTAEASEFFNYFSSEFVCSPNLIYEICNEPSTTDAPSGTSSQDVWDDVKTYSNTIIPIIRANSPDSVIIVGTPAHSSYLRYPTDEPLQYNNVLYTYHWYKDSSETITGYINPYVNSVPIFVTEWGAKAAAQGSGADYDIESAQTFLTYLAEHGISWCAWSMWQGNNSNGSTFFVDPVQNEKLRVYGGWGLNAFNIFGKLVIDNFDHAI